MSDYAWDTQFTELFDRCLTRYRAGDTNFNGYYTDADLAFLGSIGYKPRELFDFVEDHGDGGEPSVTTAVMIASVRRDYLHTIMGGKPSGHEVTPDQLPAKDSELDGVRWLPRILVKARAKLRGELNPEIMYCCGGDRRFLREHDIAPADFLRVVWASDGDDSKVLAYVRRQTA
jgi:hypothetical protein